MDSGGYLVGLVKKNRTPAAVTTLEELEGQEKNDGELGAEHLERIGKQLEEQIESKRARRRGGLKGARGKLLIRSSSESLEDDSD